MPLPDFGDITESQEPDIRSLFQQLTHMIEQKGVRTVVRVVASALWSYRRKQFMTAHQVKESHPHTYVEAPSVLAGDRPQEADTRKLGLDHDTLWSRQGKPYLFTSEPYFVTKKHLKALIAYCDQHEIDFQIDAESFYFPGHTIRILFKKGAVTPGDAVNHEDVPV